MLKFNKVSVLTLCLICSFGAQTMADVRRQRVMLRPKANAKPQTPAAPIVPKDIFIGESFNLDKEKTQLGEIIFSESIGYLYQVGATLASSCDKLPIQIVDNLNGSGETRSLNATKIVNGKTYFILMNEEVKTDCSIDDKNSIELSVKNNSGTTIDKLNLNYTPKEDDNTNIDEEVKNLITQYNTQLQEVKTVCNDGALKKNIDEIRASLIGTGSIGALGTLAGGAATGMHIAQHAGELGGGSGSIKALGKDYVSDAETVQIRQLDVSNEKVDEADKDITKQQELLTKAAAIAKDAQTSHTVAGSSTSNLRQAVLAIADNNKETIELEKITANNSTATEEEKTAATAKIAELATDNAAQEVIIDRIKDANNLTNNDNTENINTMEAKVAEKKTLLDEANAAVKKIEDKITDITKIKTNSEKDITEATAAKDKAQKATATAGKANIAIMALDSASGATNLSNSIWSGVSSKSFERLISALDNCKTKVKALDRTGMNLRILSNVNNNTKDYKYYTIAIEDDLDKCINIDKDGNLTKMKNGVIGRSVTSAVGTVGSVGSAVIVGLDQNNKKSAWGTVATVGSGLGTVTNLTSTIGGFKDLGDFDNGISGIISECQTIINGMVDITP